MENENALVKLNDTPTGAIYRVGDVHVEVIRHDEIEALRRENEYLKTQYYDKRGSDIQSPSVATKIKWWDKQGTMELLLGVIGIGAFGFFAALIIGGGNSNAPVIVQPQRQRVCDTRQSGNLLWREKEVQCRYE